MASIKDTFNRWFIPGFMLVSSVTLLVIGVPRFLHELMLVPGTPIYNRLSEGQPVSDDELTVLEQSRLDALDFVELPKAYVELGASYLIRAQRAQAQGDYDTMICFANQSISVTQKGLDMAPLQTFAWTRMATANILLGEDHYEDALQAWRMSVATAPFEPFLLLQRIHLGTILYRNMTEEDIIALKEQLGMAYRWNKGRLRQYVRENNLVIWMAILSDADEAMKAFLTER